MLCSPVPRPPPSPPPTAQVLERPVLAPAAAAGIRSALQTPDFRALLLKAASRSSGQPQRLLSLLLAARRLFQAASPAAGDSSASSSRPGGASSPDFSTAATPIAAALSAADDDSSPVSPGNPAAASLGVRYVNELMHRTDITKLVAAMQPADLAVLLLAAANLAGLRTVAITAGIRGTDGTAPSSRPPSGDVQHQQGLQHGGASRSSNVHPVPPHSRRALPLLAGGVPAPPSIFLRRLPLATVPSPSIHSSAAAAPPSRPPAAAAADAAAAAQWPPRACFMPAYWLRCVFERLAEFAQQQPAPPPLTLQETLGLVAALRAWVPLRAGGYLIHNGMTNAVLPPSNGRSGTPAPTSGTCRPPARKHSHIFSRAMSHHPHMAGSCGTGGGRQLQQLMVMTDGRLLLVSGVTSNWEGSVPGGLQRQALGNVGVWLRAALAQHVDGECLTSSEVGVESMLARVHGATGLGLIK